ncbi:hypothetical protein DNTS_020686 [Danionella cerebrum]|uniref:ubiquitinyl hydrolase 1 n=1 Tax=Danionella cerebrum TaxID=2873325 RepID=A0A553MP07_9TELE|nr:hypothetical protein DNTS_020686 [Danionella translucida]
MESDRGQKSAFLSPCTSQSLAKTPPLTHTVKAQGIFLDFLFNFNGGGDRGRMDAWKYTQANQSRPVMMDLTLITVECESVDRDTTLGFLTKEGQEGGEEKSDTLSLPLTPPGVRHSFVQEHFQAQYKSSLTCPHCLKQSNTFDPFLCISLPIPLRQTRPVYVTLVFSNKGQRYLRVGLAVPLFGSLACLRRMLADEGKISPNQVILTEIYTTGFQRSFFDEDDLTSIAESDVIYAFQAPPLYLKGGCARISGQLFLSVLGVQWRAKIIHPTVFSLLSAALYLHVSICLSVSLTFCPSPDVTLFGCTIKFDISRLHGGKDCKSPLRVTPGLVAGFHHSLPSSPYSSSETEAHRLPVSGALSSEFLNQSDGMVKILLLVCNAAGAGQQAVRFGPPFLMREDRSVSWEQLQQSILSKLGHWEQLQPTTGMHKATPNFRVLFKIRVVGGSASYSYLNPQDGRPLYHPAVDSLFGNIQEEVVKDSESVRAQQQQHVQQHSCTLEECFELYTKEEQLAPDDKWMCPHCKQLQQGMVQMSLWTLPDILILHLKRFRQVQERRNKLSTLVHFPLAGLDMGRHMVKRSGWKQQAHHRPAAGRNTLDVPYDLYAVCNHHGGMHGGHYTAFCRNSVDGQWYGYDDSSVELVPEGEVCTRAAYILFYQRRDAIPCWSASCTLQGSSSSSSSDHWLIRLKPDEQLSSSSSKLSNSSSAPEPQTPHVPVIHESANEDCKDAAESTPFVRSVRGQSMSLRYNSKSKMPPAKVLPLRWSFASKDRRKPSSVASQTGNGELVEYLESGRRPRCTKEPIVTIVASPPQVKGQLREEDSQSFPICSSNLESTNPPDSPRLPEGQSRPASVLNSISPDATRAKKSSKTTRKETQANKSLQSSPSGISTGNCSSHSRDSTMKRLRSQAAAAGRIPPSQMELPKGESQSKIGILPSKSLTKLQEGRSKEVAHGKPTSSKLSLSGSTLNGKVVEVRKTSTVHRSTSKTRGRENQLCSNPPDIKRAHSSSNIQNRVDLTLKRTLSLQRNGTLVPVSNKGLEKSSYATLQRAETGAGVLLLTGSTFKEELVDLHCRSKTHQHYEHALHGKCELFSTDQINPPTAQTLIDLTPTVPSDAKYFCAIAHLLSLDSLGCFEAGEFTLAIKHIQKPPDWRKPLIRQEIDTLLKATSTNMFCDGRISSTRLETQRMPSASSADTKRENPQFSARDLQDDLMKGFDAEEEHCPSCLETER